MFERLYLDDCLGEFRTLKTQADKAVAQVDDRQLFAAIDADANSIAVIMTHLAGNMRSRWTDFLTTDGEKPDRNRDGEFEIADVETRELVLARWEDGWSRLFAAIQSLGPGDLDATITIRGEAQSALHAINRQLSHYASHVGQIVLLAKHHAGPNWKTLSIPKKHRST